MTNTQYRQYLNTSDVIKNMTDMFVQATENDEHVSDYELINLRTTIKYLYKLGLVSWSEKCLINQHLNNCIEIDNEQ